MASAKPGGEFGRQCPRELGAPGNPFPATPLAITLDGICFLSEVSCVAAKASVDQAVVWVFLPAAVIHFAEDAVLDVDLLDYGIGEDSAVKFGATERRPALFRRSLRGRRPCLSRRHGSELRPGWGSRCGWDSRKG